MLAYFIWEMFIEYLMGPGLGDSVKGRPGVGCGDAKANHLQGAFGVTKSCRPDSQLRGCWRGGNRAGSWASEEAARVVTQPLSECFSMRVLTALHEPGPVVGRGPFLHGVPAPQLRSVRMVEFPPC